MWHRLLVSPTGEFILDSSVSELLRSVSRAIITVIGGTYMACLIAAGIWPDLMAINLLLIFPAVVFTCYAAWRLLPQHYLLAHFVWQGGLSGIITLVLYLFQRPELAFLYAFLPLMAVVTVGWPLALVVEALVILLAWWVSHGLIASSPSPSVIHSVGVAVGATVAGLLGWASSYSLLTVAQWSFSGYEQARKRAEEALAQRLKFKQAQADLTQANNELARLSDRLEEMYQVAEGARRAKEDFVANVSHELRTPLNMIIGFSEMLLESSQVYGATLPTPVLVDIAAIERNSRHLSRLVDDVLDLSQIEVGRMALSKELTSVPDIIDAAVSTVRALFESKGLYLRTEVPAELPLVFCDPTRVRQVTINVLSNAGRFTEQGGVLVKAWHKEDSVVVCIADTGPGIPLEGQEKLFEPFQQLDGFIDHSHEGSGLGLSISKRFVEMHGGKMWLESETGVGTSIYFSLPITTPSSALLDDGVMRWFSPYHQYEKRADRSRVAAPVVLPRFLLFEEGHSLQRLFSRYMDDVEVASFQKADEVVAELSRLPAQALIVNRPPFESNPAHTDPFGTLPYGTPLVTCWVPGEDDAARRLGVVRYLTKPVNREELLSTLEDLADVKSVLLADDEPQVLQLFSRMLASAGRDYHVLRATSGQQALDLLRERRPDVILLDLIMPRMDGFQVLREKSRDPSICGIPVIIVSARDPSNEPIVSNMLAVTRDGGLSASALLSCIRAVSEILTASA